VLEEPGHGKQSMGARQREECLLHHIEPEEQQADGQHAGEGGLQFAGQLGGQNQTADADQEEGGQAHIDRGDEGYNGGSDIGAAHDDQRAV